MINNKLEENIEAISDNYRIFRNMFGALLIMLINLVDGLPDGIRMDGFYKDTTDAKLQIKRNLLSMEFFFDSKSFVGSRLNDLKEKEDE